MRPIYISFLMLALLTAVTAMGSTDAATHDSVVLELPLVWPEGSKWRKQMDESAERVAAQTEGRVRVVWTEGSVLRQVPAAAIYSLPLIFRSTNEIAAVRSVVDEPLTAFLRQNGFEVLGMEFVGCAYVMSCIPIVDCDTLSSVRVWVPAGEAAGLSEVLGLKNPIPLPRSEVREALREERVRAVVIHPGLAIAGRWHTELSYVTDFPLTHLFTVLAAPVDAFASLSEPDRECVRKVLGTTYCATALDCLSKHEQALTLLRKRKRTTTFVQPSDEQRAGWDTWAESMRKRQLECGALSAPLVEALLRELERIRR